MTDKKMTSKSHPKEVLDTASRLYNLTEAEEPSLKIRRDTDGKIKGKEIFLSTWNREFIQEHGVNLSKSDGKPAENKQAINRAITDSIKQLCAVMLVHGATIEQRDAKVELLKSRTITIVDDPSFGDTDFMDNEEAFTRYLNSISG